MRRTTGIAIALCTAFVMSACSSDHNSTSTTTVTPPSTADSSTPTTSTTTTTTTSTNITSTTTSTTSTTSTTTSTTQEPSTSSGPTPIAADDWKAVLEELARRRVSLYASPDVSQIGEYCASGSDCEAGLQTQLADAVAKGEHIEGQHPFEVLEITEASISETPGTDQQIATVTFVAAPDTPPAARLVDASGNIIDTLSLTTTKSQGRFTLVSVDDPILPWRVLLAEDLGPA